MIKIFIKNFLKSLTIFMLTIVVLSLGFPRLKACRGCQGIYKDEYNLALIGAFKNDENSFTVLNRYFSWFVPSFVVVLDFYKQFADRNSFYADYESAMYIVQNTKTHKEYLSDIEIKKQLNTALFLLKRAYKNSKANDFEYSDLTKRYLDEYKDLSDTQIIATWKKEIKEHNASHYGRY